MNTFFDRLLALPPPEDRAYTGIRRLIRIPHSSAKQEKLANDVFYIQSLFFSYPLYALTGLCVIYMFALFFHVVIDLPFFQIAYPDTGYIYYFGNSFSFYGFYFGLLAALYPSALLIKHIDLTKTNITAELHSVHGRGRPDLLKTTLRYFSFVSALVYLNPFFFPRIGGTAVKFLISHSPSLADPGFIGLSFILIFYVCGITALIALGSWLLFVFINSFLYKETR